MIRLGDRRHCLRGCSPMMRLGGRTIRGFSLGADDGPAVIKQSVIDAWIPFNTAKLHWVDGSGTTRSTPNEGIRLPSWMYEDVLGLVTTGMGNMIETPSVSGPTTDAQFAAGVGPGPSLAGEITPIGLHAGWTHADGTPATDDEVRAEFQRVKSEWTRHMRESGGFNAAGRASAQLFLPEPAVRQLINRVLQGFADQLNRQVPFSTFPADAQIALLSHSWADGASLSGWPKLKAALTRGDFRGAAQEDVTHAAGGVITPQLKDRNDAIARAYLNADDVLQVNGDIDRLYFPGTVRDTGVQVPMINPDPSSQTREIPRGRPIPSQVPEPPPVRTPSPKPASGTVFIVGTLALAAAAAAAYATVRNQEA
jgi:hypothetical protein